MILNINIVFEDENLNEVMINFNVQTKENISCLVQGKSCLAEEKKLVL
jgi:hypothetical protein